ncbi:MAG: nitrate reductase cytochrome c-type subunit [Planctomycetaceae bacterium]
MVACGFLFSAVFSGGGVATAQPGINIYPSSQPGQTEKLERPYKGAPPLIPHSVEGLGIARSSNDCLSCHSEGIEIEKGHIATKVPASHYVNEYTREQTKEQVIGLRYNCLQCHVPQTIGERGLDLRIQSAYSSEDGRKEKR